MKKGLLVVMGLLLILIVAACSGNTPNKKEAQDIKKMVQDYSVEGNSDDMSASITSDELIVTDSNNKETTYDLPEDEFFVSIAPFINTTHPCTNHSLTGCQGELVDKGTKNSMYTFRMKMEMWLLTKPCHHSKMDSLIFGYLVTKHIKLKLNMMGKKQNQKYLLLRETILV